MRYDRYTIELREGDCMGKIRVNNMVVYTHNGVFPEERRLGQRLEVDLELAYPIEQRVQHDDLNETVSYADVYATARDFLRGHQFKLIESAANGLLRRVLTDYPTLTGATVRIRKYGVPIDGAFDNVEIEVRGGHSDD